MSGYYRIATDSEVQSFSENKMLSIKGFSRFIVAKDDKIVILTSKGDGKKILSFLDEEAYKGPFSQKIYLANSKRNV